MPHPLLHELPLIAILRGLHPGEAIAIGEALVSVGFRCIEVPLNSPDPLTSIAALRGRLDGRALVGAGTVLTLEQVAAVASAGGQIIVSPNANSDVIRATKMAELVSLPAFATPTEAFTAIDAGADGLKLFPAEMSGAPALAAMKAILPADMPVFPVGGITRETMAAFRKAGAAGFGIGSAIYKPGMTAADVGLRAGTFVKAWRDLIQNADDRQD